MNPCELSHWPARLESPFALCRTSALPLFMTCERCELAKLGIPFTAPEGRGTPAWWTPLDTRSLDLITRARFRRWTNASVTTRPAASTSVVCAGLKDSPAPIAERRGSHG